MSKLKIISGRSNHFKKYETEQSFGGIEKLTFTETPSSSSSCLFFSSLLEAAICRQEESMLCSVQSFKAWLQSKDAQLTVLGLQPMRTWLLFSIRDLEQKLTHLHISPVASFDLTVIQTTCVLCNHKANFLLPTARPSSKRFWAEDGADSCWQLQHQQKVYFPGQLLGAQSLTWAKNKWQDQVLRRDFMLCFLTAFALLLFIYLFTTFLAQGSKRLKQFALTA